MPTEELCNILQQTGCRGLEENELVVEVVGNSLKILTNDSLIRATQSVNNVKSVVRCLVTASKN
jgi:hypothetical protein